MALAILSLALFMAVSARGMAPAGPHTAAWMLPGLLALGGAWVQEPRGCVAPGRIFGGFVWSSLVLVCFVLTYAVAAFVFEEVFRVWSFYAYDGYISLSLSVAVQSAAFLALFSLMPYALCRRIRTGQRVEFVSRMAIALIASTWVVPLVFFALMSPVTHWRLDLFK